MAFTQGSGPGSGSGFALKGYVGGKPWRLELGRPSRDYIHGQELRARAELGIDEDAAVLLMNRPLKDALEKKAYATYTDGLQTIAAMGLPEEIRWLSLYQEVGWDSLPREFWARYAVLADRRENALAWIDPPLAQQLMAWPQPAPGPEVPFMLLLLRGKAYLRMQYDSASMSTFQHATAVFTGACEAAIGGLPAGRPR
ncbi:Conserved hypothetical protein [Ramlibacter tataouinensis TTB310]|uniref:Uncharacterized protein n=2 Tax=Ramlibacter tataouinensis TaxID=94132 RepID=F5XZU4_RAMTT|nr:Conserved hypothetical protein [Ramlibacter tataouinensis TTB310]